MNFRLLPFFAFHLCVSVSLSYGTPIVPPSGNLRAEDVRFAGSAEGKTFFTVYNGTSLNWMQAGLACQQMNMKFAELESPAQVSAVRNQSGQLVDAWYWVGGRDAFAPRQFSWNSTDIDFSLSELTLRAGYIPTNPYSCVKYAPRQSYIYSSSCTSTSLYRICEISTSKLSQSSSEIMKMNVKMNQEIE